jgi:hypothetical protein
VAGFLAAVWRYAGTRVATFALAGLVLLLPSSSIFPAADLAADRRMYLPMLAFAAALGIVLARLRPQLIAILAVVLLTGLSFARTQAWMSERSLWTEAVERSPAKVRPKIQLARALPAARALELLSKAREENPYDPALAEIGKTCWLTARRRAQRVRTRSRSIHATHAVSTTAVWPSNWDRPRPRRLPQSARTRRRIEAAQNLRKRLP